MQKFIGKKLLFIVAHPDDESFTSGGTMWENHLAGGENYIICATLGERGKSHMTKPVTQSQLKKIRKQELTAVAKFLKVNGLYFFSFPDAGLKEKASQFSVKTEALIKKIKPDYILSFGPDGMSGHLDHIAAGAVSRSLAKKLKIPFLAFGAPPALRKQFKKIITRRRFGKYAANVTHAIPNIKIKIDFKHKLQTLKFHKSQVGQSTLFAPAPKLPSSVFRGYEYFVK
jgi:LmbE family N-acetylglucosaminyl deacetylase